MLRRAALVGLLTAAALAGGPGLASAQEAGPGVGQLARTDDMAVLRMIGVPAAWAVSRGAGVTVGVLDTGGSLSAADLTGSVKAGPDYAAGANPPGYRPPHLHGTYIASLIAGHGSGPGRSAGVLGVAPRAKILSVRVILDDQEPGFSAYSQNAAYDDAIASGIRYAVQHGAGVLNASLGGEEATRSVRQALGYAIARGVVVVAAAGNNGTSRPSFTPYSYPASFPGVVSVAAVGRNGKRAYFSDRNSSVVVAAPGVNIVGDGPSGSYLSGSGTSPASAFVAGIAALIRSKYPRLSPGLVAQAIVDSARRRPPGGYSPSVGFGEVDAAAALTAAGRLAAGPPSGPRAMSPSARFAPGAGGPIVVDRHDNGLIALLAAIAALGALGAIAFAVTAVKLARRPRGRAAPGVPESLAGVLPAPTPVAAPASEEGAGEPQHTRQDEPRI